MSSVIKAADYDRQRATMKITLHSGESYEYRVSPRVWSEFLRSPSKGGYFSQNIRHLKHRKV